MNNKTILVIGGTGMLGKPVAQQLKADGFNVRLLAQKPRRARKLLGDGFEIIKGGVDDVAALQTALTGVDGVHISLKGGLIEADFERMDHFAVRDISRIAKEQNVGRVTLVSAYAVSEEKADTPECRSKVRGEAALKSSGIPYTIFRASWFMETLPLFVEIRPLFVEDRSISLIGKQVHPLHWIAIEDYARMVSKSYQTDESLNKELYIFGPEAFTMGEAMKMYADLAGLKVAQISTTMLSLQGMLTFDDEWKGIAALMKHYEKWGEDGSPDEANHLLGAPRITLKEWCEKNRTFVSG